MKFEIGQEVNYHSIIGGPVTHTGKIKHTELQPNNFGCDVVWITGKSGCVDIDHLTAEGIKEYD